MKKLIVGHPGKFFCFICGFVHCTLYPKCDKTCKVRIKDWEDEEAAPYRSKDLGQV